MKHWIFGSKDYVAYLASKRINIHSEYKKRKDGTTNGHTFLVTFKRLENAWKFRLSCRT